MVFVSDAADTHRATGRFASYAYRDFGVRESIPRVLLQRFRGTVDHWDPAFLEPLAAQRRVVVFDSSGVAESSGTVPTTGEEMAEGRRRLRRGTRLHGR